MLPTSEGVADEGVGAELSMSPSDIEDDITTPLDWTVARMMSLRELVRLTLKLPSEVTLGDSEVQLGEPGADLCEEIDDEFS